MIERPRKKSTSSRKGDPKRDGFVARDSKGSKIYEEPMSKKKTRPKEPPRPTRQSVASASSYGDEEDDDELPLEQVRREGGGVSSCMGQRN